MRAHSKDKRSAFRLYQWFRFLQMPGPDLFTRRRTLLKKYFMKGNRSVLDCGCGNGWFSYLAYRSGAKVIAITSRKDEAEKARSFFNGFKEIDDRRLSFLELNAYDLKKLNLENQVDEIICFETLEHIKKDQEICTIFGSLLRKGGILHLCCPNADHPRWKKEMLDLGEGWGGHVRAGYTLNSYKHLLEPLGFEIKFEEKVGGHILVFFTEIINWIHKRLGTYAAGIISYLFSPSIYFDRVGDETPYCLYVKAKK